MWYQAFTPEFRASHPALARYLQTIYSHPAAQRVLRGALPAPGSELQPGGLSSLVGQPIQRFVNVASPFWSGGCPVRRQQYCG